jgi:hypothetical protein
VLLVKVNKAIKNRSGQKSASTGRANARLLLRRYRISESYRFPNAYSQLESLNPSFMLSKNESAKGLLSVVIE